VNIADPAQVSYVRAPERNEHFDEVVALLGYDEATVARLNAARAFGTN
jgi:hypothetical protein